MNVHPPPQLTLYSVGPDRCSWQDIVVILPIETAPALCIVQLFSL